MSRRHGLIGASKPYLYKEEDAEFYYRQTSGGVIMNNSPLVGSIDRIKGQTIAWNQLRTEKFIPDATNETNTITNDGYYNTITRLSGTTQISIVLFPSKPDIIGHKVFYKFETIFDNSFSVNNGIIFYGKNVSLHRSGVGVKTGITTANSDESSRRRLFINPSPDDVGKSIKISPIICIDLTLIYGKDNEPSTPEEFEADYFKWFGKPLTYEPYDEGSLRNVQMEGIKTTFSNASPQTRNFDVTTLTGKLNGEGESVVIFPDGMKGVNDVKDEIYIEDGVTKAVKRIGRVDLGSSDVSYNRSFTVPYFMVSLSDLKSNPIRNVKIICSRNYSQKSVDLGQFRTNDSTFNADTFYPRIATKNIIYKNPSLTSKAQFQTAMSGVYLDYELAEPQVYVLDTPLPIDYNCEAGGTEQILPEEVGTGIAPIMDITYKIGQINN